MTDGEVIARATTRKVAAGRVDGLSGTGDIRERLGIFSGDKMGHVMVV